MEPIRSHIFTEPDDNTARTLKVLQSEFSPTGRSRSPGVHTIPETADILRLSTKTIRNLLNSGQLKGVRTGTYSGKWRISESAIEEFLMGD